tara:strand:- start:651 stop:1415 length:765 start_codon:yes stop_codon:yes gene_type:complete
MQEKKITVVDIGASYGSFILYILKTLKKKEIKFNLFAIEPIKEVTAKLKENKEIRLFNLAISNKSNITNTAYLNKLNNSELSSLKKINKNIDKVLWKSHISGLEIKERVKVETSSLSDFIDINNIKEIDFLKIDTQGLDLEVFLSAKNYINIINSAVLEFPYDSQSSLYDDETTLIEALEILEKKGFYPVRIVPNGGGECNLFIYNKNFGIDAYFKLEDLLDLKKAPTLKIKLENIYLDKIKNKIKIFLRFIKF